MAEARGGVPWGNEPAGTAGTAGTAPNVAGGKATARPPEASPITVDLPPEPPLPTRAAMDVRWLTNLGVVYFRQHQFGEAFQCFRRAAEQQLPAAQFCLAVCFFNGQGTATDEAQALVWLNKAAAGGDANAELTLGLAYRFGRGVAPDPVLAVQWLELAARHGHPEATRQLQEMKPAPPSPPPPSPPPPTVVSIPRVVPIEASAPPLPPAVLLLPSENTPPGRVLQRLLLGLLRQPKGQILSKSEGRNPK